MMNISRSETHGFENFSLHFLFFIAFLILSDEVGLGANLIKIHTFIYFVILKPSSQ